jgi:VanZ family protein
MTDAPMYPSASPRASGWSHRILIAALAGIFFLTLYPFRFSFAPHSAGGTFLYVLDSGEENKGLFAAFLNVLLFVPCGIGFAELLRDRSKSWVATLGLTLAAATVLSYTIEVVQAYIPFRDSGWEDIITNSTGALVGSLLFELCGTAVLRVLSACERALVAFLTLPRTVIILLAYFGLWFTICIPFQKETRLSNWSPDALLVVGNGASGRLASAWKGEVFQLELWDHALPSALARKLTSGKAAEAIGPVSLAAYEFSDSSRFQDQRHLLPELSWAPSAPARSDSEPIAFDGKSWLVSRGPVSAFVNDVQKTRQFSVRVLCKPAAVDRIRGRIVSISQVSGPVNLEIRQEDSKLVFWFRNPLSVRQSRLTWTLSGVFARKQPRDILFSYDGSNLSLYIDGREERRTYRLGPATALAQLIRHMQTVELEGYQYILYALVFVPGGCVLGLAWRNRVAPAIGWYLLIVNGLLAPAVFLEIVLAQTSGRATSLGNIALAALLALGGSLWVNADGGAPYRSSNSNTRNLAGE